MSHQAVNPEVNSEQTAQALEIYKQVASEQAKTIESMLKTMHAPIPLDKIAELLNSSYGDGQSSVS